MNQTDTLLELYRKINGHTPESIERLAGAGSNRVYYRLHGSPTLIGVTGISSQENQAFISLSRQFNDAGLPMPCVHAVSEDSLCYLQDDLGNLSLFDYIKMGRESSSFSQPEIEILKQTIRTLPHIQFCNGKTMNFDICYPQREFNDRSIHWDLNYFKYCFLKTTGIEFEEHLLEDDFDTLCRLLSNTSLPKAFLYRDFQSRNVMIKNGEPYFIDFQGGRKGPIHYDVASFLWQAKANFPDELREMLIDDYLDELQHYIGIDRNEFKKMLRLFVFFRTLQVLGAYGFRGYIEKKTHFIESIPPAIRNLQQLLPEIKLYTPYLAQTLQEMVSLPRFHSESSNTTGLTVTVMSFSYRKGIPEDYSGNGGGYVFDCRAIHNPGKYEPYKKLTGLDHPVIEFLESDGEITQFLSHVYPIVDFHVETYMKRGFSNLSVSFGCTGGQHRSVYSAQHVAEHLHNKYGVKVHLIHREQNITTIFE